MRLEEIGRKLRFLWILFFIGITVYSRWPSKEAHKELLLLQDSFNTIKSYKRFFRPFPGSPMVIEFCLLSNGRLLAKRTVSSAENIIITDYVKGYSYDIKNKTSVRIRVEDEEIPLDVGCKFLSQNRTLEFGGYSKVNGVDLSILSATVNGKKVRYFFGTNDGILREVLLPKNIYLVEPFTISDIDAVPESYFEVPSGVKSISDN
jgi:hypothetical protein